MPAFLFTDLESSTRLWEEHPEQMAGALARHDAILREAIAEGHGEVVKSTGDGMLALFDSVSDSVRASLAAQLRLHSEVWPTDPLRVRMGVHVGDGEARDGDLYGPAVNRAARIMAAGHGGQVLLSAAAAQMASLPDGVVLRDLGTHRLKDLTLPERLFQLVHDGLRTDFPPPATLDARVNNLPIQVSEFFGREHELSAVRQMVDTPTLRLLTLTGPGGVGKTRLALQVAAEVLDGFRNGVFFVDLSSETDPNSAAEAIVLALDLQTAGGGQPLRILQTRLRDLQILLVLDNLEQVTELASGLVELIQHCPDLKILATSREALRVRAEHVFPVPALSLPHPASRPETIGESEAVRLFIERARAVRPDFALTDENAQVIAELCQRLDGLPLAIELAAARLNVFSPAELIERLRGRLDVLVSGHRDLPDRQRTLWGAIGWSYELLDPGECRVFEMMSVFSPTGLAALEAVAAEALSEPSILDPLASLVDKSLVRSEEVGGSQRFSMLQTIREYAAERLSESGREDAVRSAHARHFTAELASGDMAGTNRQAVVAHHASSIDNLRTAWRYWLDTADLDRVLEMVDPLWALHDALGWYHAAIGLTDDALGLLADAPSDFASWELALRTRLARALLLVRGYTAEVDEAFRRVLATAAAAPPAERLALFRPIATYYITTGDFTTAGRLGAELLELAEQEGDAIGLIDGHYLSGMGAAFAGDVAAGVTQLDLAAELFDARSVAAGRLRVGPSVGVTARVASGLLRYQAGEIGGGISRVERALEVARGLRHPISLAYALWHNGLLDIYRMRYGSAALHAAELQRVSSAADYPVWRTLASVLEGVSQAGSGHLDRGVELTEAAVDLYLGLTTPPVFWPNILHLRAMVFLMAGDPVRALELIDAAIDAVGDRDAAGPELHILRGDVLRVHPHHGSEAAVEAHETARRASRKTGMRLLNLMASARLVQLSREDGRQPDGTDELRALYDTFTDGFDEFEMRSAAALLS